MKKLITTNDLEKYVLTIKFPCKNILELTYDNEPTARKAFHGAVSVYGLKFVTVTKEVA